MSMCWESSINFAVHKEHCIKTPLRFDLATKKSVSTNVVMPLCSLISQPVFFLGGGVKEKGLKKNKVWANLTAFHDRLVCQSDYIDTLLDCKYVHIKYA